MWRVSMGETKRPAVIAECEWKVVSRTLKVGHFRGVNFNRLREPRAQRLSKHADKLLRACAILKMRLLLL